MYELESDEVALVSGGDLLDVSSRLGHLGRALGFGLAIGAGIVWYANVGDSGQGMSDVQGA